MAAAPKLVLPEAPAELPGPVRAWEQAVAIETYEPEAANRNPMFLESRVYQGSNGKVYPLPIIDGIARDSTPREWRALHIENEFLRVMILPELGGRIHVGLDKTNGYDFFYRQNVIKPALVGLAGPWASGGVEFNWPQHHRPATYMPVETLIERHADGSITVWCSDHDPFARMKAAHGVCLHPGRSILELKVRLYNRTPLRHTFLWWANAAVRVHEQYQSFFPPDVHFVADHAERAISTYPLCEGSYYGVDYARRAKEGTPAEEMPAAFVPPGSYAANDLRWYGNIPVPTSYMAIGSAEDFFGGYDHAKRAGVIHVADHHIAPGKKQWTWGNHDFGYAWDRQLTDSDGPYIELMAGVYTDNQPDFSFLEPGETKTFRQVWYPIRDIGVAHAANERAALHVEAIEAGRMKVAVHATEVLKKAVLSAGSFSATVDLDPAHPAIFEMAEARCVKLSDSKAAEILCYSLKADSSALPTAATEPPNPSEVESIDELVLIGQHLEQYRHATRDPILYWREGLRRDPQETRCLKAMALWHLRRGEFEQAEAQLEKAIARLTKYNGNPPSGNAFYHLGLVRRFLNRDQAAYDAFYKATWNYAQRSAAFYALAEMDAKVGRFREAIEHLRAARRTNADDLRVRCLEAVLLRKIGLDSDGTELLGETARLDPTDVWTRYLLFGAEPSDNQTRLDLAFDYARAGLFAEACEICEKADISARDGSVPLVFYALAYFTAQTGADSERWLKAARDAAPEYCFPNRLEELVVLQRAGDSRAQYYLGNFLYDRKRYGEAIEAWETATRAENAPATAWRNLGIAYYNVKDDGERARKAFDRAFQLDDSDARVFFERDQLWKRMGVPQAQRLAELESHKGLVDERDDLSIEWIDLLNQAGRHEEALTELSGRQFRPWEGGEGLASEQHVCTHVALGREALLARDAARALRFFEAALRNPDNLGEGRHLLANRANVYFWMGAAYFAQSDREAAEKWWRKAIASERDFQEMSVKPYSAMSFYRVLAFQRLQMWDEAKRLIRAIEDYAEHLKNSEAKVDYFATSLPNTLLFKDNLQRRQELLAKLLCAQMLLVSGETAKGEKALVDIVQLQPSHTAASDLLKESQALTELHLYAAGHGD